MLSNRQLITPRSTVSWMMVSRIGKCHYRQAVTSPKALSLSLRVVVFVRKENERTVRSLRCPARILMKSIRSYYSGRPKEKMPDCLAAA